MDGKRERGGFGLDLGLMGGWWKDMEGLCMDGELWRKWEGSDLKAGLEHISG